MQNIVVLVGGVGGAKLAHGLAQILPPERLTIIVNTADDFWRYGLRICPDLDTVMYTLAGLVDKTTGWGIAGDTRNMLSAFARYGEPTWFGLGDQDIATHLLRTRELTVGGAVDGGHAAFDERAGHSSCNSSDDRCSGCNETGYGRTRRT